MFHNPSGCIVGKVSRAGSVDLWADFYFFSLVAKVWFKLPFERAPKSFPHHFHFIFKPPRDRAKKESTLLAIVILVDTYFWALTAETRISSWIGNSN